MTKPKEIITYKSQDVSFFPAGDPKTAMNRQESMTKMKQKLQIKNDPQQKLRLGPVSKKNFTGGLKLVL